MATKLYPPYIEGTIPAFCGTTLVVPFALNKAVSKTDIAGFVLKIKTVQGSTLLKTIKETRADYYDLDSNMQCLFDVSGVPFVVGQYYKVQLAFIGSDSTVGYFSTVGVTKYTTEPDVYINELTIGAINNHEYYYTGVYSQEGKDTTEKMYSSRFVLKDNSGNIIVDSGDILHNTANDDNSYESYEKFTIERDLDENSSYYLTFKVTTSNNYTATAGPYRIMQKKSVTSEIQASVKATLDYEDGYVDVYLVGKTNDDGTEDPAVGSFIVCRAASNENYVWHQVCKFTLQSQIPTRFLWRDYTVEQGVTYKYSVQQYNDFDLFSERIESNEVTADFEDAFLFDGSRQLKIRYNPKVSSFKTDLLETKTDTIGGKHPFIFRNGNVCYKEFPISGLISYQMDDNQLFMSREDLGISVFSNDLTSDNILAERLFKNAVLDWLNNGEEKLFRSPTEGNFIVRLMNTSLSPNDTLGRMLHTFSSTAYEVSDFEYSNLLDYGFISVDDVSTEQMRWMTVELAGQDSDLDDLLANIRRYVNAGITVLFSEVQYNRIINYNSALAEFFTAQSDGVSYYISTNTINSLSTEDLENLLTDLEEIQSKVTYVTGRINSRPAYSIHTADMLPGTMMVLTTEKAGEEPEIIYIQIGATGSYSASFSTPVTKIEIPATQSASELVSTGLQGSITYSYKSSSVNVFDTIRTVTIEDIPCQQWIGQQTKTYYNKDKDATITTHDLIEIIEDSKISIVDFYFLRFYSRPMTNVFIKDLYYNPTSLAVGVNIDSGVPEGIHLTSINLNELTYEPNKYYIEYTKKETVEGGDDITHTFLQVATGSFDENKTYYEISYTYYKDMNCTQELPMDELDPYSVYAICHGRFDYTYVNQWYEGYYVYANYNRGYYVDADGNKTDVFTGMLLDGRSTSNNIITYEKDTYTNQITINGETIDIAETTKWEVREFETPITSLLFNNGVICEASYQVRNVEYNIETASVNKTVNSYKNTWLAYKNRLQQLRQNADLYDTDQFVTLQTNYITNINTSYAAFIYQLDIALKLYEEENTL